MALALSPVVNIPIPSPPYSAIMSNNLDMNGYAITNLPAPSAATDAARKQDTEGITLGVLNASGTLVSVGLSK